MSVYHFINKQLFFGFFIIVIISISTKKIDYKDTQQLLIRQ